jgi:hypothetical protein
MCTGPHMFPPPCVRNRYKQVDVNSASNVSNEAMLKIISGSDTRLDFAQFLQSRSRVRPLAH